MSFDKILWANFRAEVKHRGEQVQDVFDRLMASYLNVKQPNRSVSPTNRQNTNAVKEAVTVVTEESALAEEDDARAKRILRAKTLKRKKNGNQF